MLPVDWAILHVPKAIHQRNGFMDHKGAPHANEDLPRINRRFYSTEPR